MYTITWMHNASSFSFSTYYYVLVSSVSLNLLLETFKCPYLSVFAINYKAKSLSLFSNTVVLNAL